MTPQEVTAIILAAGSSLRTKDFKPLLLIGGMTILERTVRLFQQNGIRDTKVVVGHRWKDLVPVLQYCGATWVVNEDYQQGMFSSVVAGISRLEVGREAFFLLPVDIPLVRSQTIRDLLKAYPKAGRHILYPTFQGTRGHPPLIAKTFTEKVSLWNGDGGLRSFLRQHETESLEVEVVDEYILQDIDTMADYEELVLRHRNYEVPSIMECREILTKKFPVARSLLEHCQKVAQVAFRLGEELNRSGHQLNLGLIVAGSLLHDMAKDQPHHAKTGERFLEELGFPAVAKVVGTHQDIFLRKEDQLTEEDIVYLADKMVRGNQLVPLQEGYQIAKERFATDPQASVAVEKRWADAFLIKEKVEKGLGRALGFFFAEPLPNDLFTETW
ncbi:MAG TPA: NTP transferase domain-containing protein [Syntrophales bacterium]|nr:NTP transferase domain-containing protein [Syntrophales bacterium]